MKSSKSNVKTTTLAIRQKKMSEISSLIRFFVCYANKRKDALFAKGVRFPFSYCRAQNGYDTFLVVVWRVL